MDQLIIGPTKIVIAVRLGESLIIDDAINLELSDLKAYEDTYYNEKHIKYIAGEIPAYWHIQPLTRAQLRDSQTMQINDRVDWYLRCSMVLVENYFLMNKDGERLSTKLDFIDDKKYGRIVSEKSLEELHLSLDRSYALFTVISRISAPSIPFLKS